MSRDRYADDEDVNPFAAPETDLDESFVPAGKKRKRPGQLEYGTFSARFAAAFIDGIITGILGFLMGLAVGTSGVGSQVEQQAIVNVVGVVIGWLYAALQESSRHQATLGKRAIGLVVTDLDGNRISFGRATGRHFGKFVSTIVILIGYLMQPFTKRRQALHDIMAGCLVVKS